MASQPISSSNRKRSEQTETEHAHSWHTNGFEYIYILKMFQPGSITEAHQCLGKAFLRTNGCHAYWAMTRLILGAWLDRRCCVHEEIPLASKNGAVPLPAVHIDRSCRRRWKAIVSVMENKLTFRCWLCDKYLCCYHALKLHSAVQMNYFTYWLDKSDS